MSTSTGACTSNTLGNLKTSVEHAMRRVSPQAPVAMMEAWCQGRWWDSPRGFTTTTETVCISLRSYNSQADPQLRFRSGDTFKDEVTCDCTTWFRKESNQWLHHLRAFGTFDGETGPPLQKHGETASQNVSRQSSRLFQNAFQITHSDAQTRDMREVQRKTFYCFLWSTARKARFYLLNSKAALFFFLQTLSFQQD